MRLGASAMRLLLGGYVASVKRTASAPNAGKPLPIAAADGYAFLNFASASASGAPGSVFVDHLGERRAVDEIERVDDVALHLAHLVAGLVDDEAGEEHAAERHLAHEVQAEHHHAGDPEEEDVVAVSRSLAG